MMNLDMTLYAFSKMVLLFPSCAYLFIAECTCTHKFGSQFVRFPQLEVM